MLNACEARWRERPERGLSLPFEGGADVSHVGVTMYVLGPGEPIGMDHWEAGQEDFLVLSGEALLIVEGLERPLRQGDVVHCPPHTKHMIVGAGDGESVVLVIGARVLDAGVWGGYSVDETARRHRVSIEEETGDVDVAYARFQEPAPTGYREGWLPTEHPR